MGKLCLHASSFIFDRIIIKVAGNQDIKAWTSSISGLWFTWPIYMYMFIEMRFDLGTLDSGEQLLPFGLLVFKFNEYIFFSFVLQPSYTAFILLSYTD